ncbi:LysR family transcriptional regulator [Agrobacterium larrymoorei]|uniref:HTH-type transcriptional regulator TtuA n=1 Tax=Agrobacterium larrymoorei TaxID=160699 RepID=A0A4D7DTF8_9HYPH|nr:LysR family transcriptional regulator [Agrobacterium larrymoorei]QCI97542.1 LysR family transcriptional regulator [Agrobacterium larrymoorei]QYA07018.1 LysR family transcriptional regulator [Agrobacterium larrymoorei]
MDKLGALTIFVHTAEGGSFVAASQRLGLSSSAVGKAIARLEQEMGVRLFHRSTRSMTLTEEGSFFLDTCRRVLSELDSAEAQLSKSQSKPRGLLRVSFPLTGMLLMPAISAFMKAYPEIDLDLDFTDRLVDVIEEGFDAVVRTGEVRDTRLMNRKLGSFKHRLVASPDYLTREGVPQVPEDLMRHRCMHHRYANSGKLEPWPLVRDGKDLRLALPTTTIASTLEPLIHLAENGFGISCLPDFAVAKQIEDGNLISLLDCFTAEAGVFRVLWPTSRYLSPKIRVFVDFMAENLFVARRSAGRIDSKRVE